MSTIQVSERLLAEIRIYCAIRKIPVGDFVEALSSRDKDFINFIKKSKKLNL